MSPQPGPERHNEPTDLFESKPVASSEVAYHGMIWDVRRDEVELQPGSVVRREYVDHPGAVAMVPLRGEPGHEEVLLIRQYRHAVKAWLWEVPAGLLDQAGEPPLEAAQRELAEEVDLVAERWDVLVDSIASPGSFAEHLRVYLARDLTASGSSHERGEEEAELELAWVSLDDARDAVLAGRIHNPGAIMGILATWNARATGWEGLRPGDSDWRAHPAYR